MPPYTPCERRPQPLAQLMKSRLSFIALCVVVLTCSLPNLAPAADKPAKSDSAEVENKKNITVLVLKAAPEAVHTAALQALAGIGCEVKKDSPTAIEGKR